MVKKIALMRHAQASMPWGMDDFGRELSAAGHAQAKCAGIWFRENFRPSVVLCSSALRTRQTYMWVAERLGEKAPTAKLEQGLYNAGEKDIISFITSISETVDNALIIGHNPGIQRSSIALASRKSEQAALANACASFEPASIALIEHSLPWAELQNSYSAGTIHASEQWQLPKMVDYISGSSFMG